MLNFMIRISKAKQSKATKLLYNMSGFQYIGGNIFNMNGFICPAARARTFAEIPLRSHVGKETVK